MIQQLINWWRGVKVIETQCFNYEDADKLLRQGLGWRLSPLEDQNVVIGVVWLERVTKNDDHTAH